MKPRTDVTEGDIRYVVEPLLYPPKEFGAHIEVYREGPRGGAKRYVKLGPRVIADTPTHALTDLRTALYTDRLPEVRIVPTTDQEQRP